MRDLLLQMHLEELLRPSVSPEQLQGLQVHKVPVSFCRSFVCGGMLSMSPCLPNHKPDE